jgi:hypothetical protein
MWIGAARPSIGRDIPASVTVCRHRTPNLERCGPARPQSHATPRHREALNLQIIPDCAFTRCESAARRLGSQVRSAVRRARVPKVQSTSRPCLSTKPGRDRAACARYPQEAQGSYTTRISAFCGWAECCTRYLQGRSPVRVRESRGRSSSLGPTRPKRSWTPPARRQHGAQGIYNAQALV